jgi:hypothetical protein
MSLMPSHQVPRSMDDLRHSVSTLIRFVASPGNNSRGNSNHSSKVDKLDCDLNLSSHSKTDQILSMSNHGVPSDSAIQESSNHSSTRRNSSDSATMVAKLSNIPLHVRGRAEKWELPRSQIQISSKIGEGQGGVVYKCRWRSLDCAAKLLTQDSTESIAYFDMVNEISIISHLRHPNLVLFLGACTVGSEPLLILSEFMEGGSLEDRFTKALGRPSIKVALRWIIDLSRAICFLHNCTTPIIHRYMIFALNAIIHRYMIFALNRILGSYSHLHKISMILQRPQARQPLTDRRRSPQGTSPSRATLNCLARLYRNIPQQILNHRLHRRYRISGYARRCIK